MRVALISIHETLPLGSETRLRAMLQVAGKSVAQWQVDMALAAGCSKVLCVASDISHNIIALQHSIEARGAEFHLIGSKARLSALVRATDEMLVLADGLLPLASEGVALLTDGPDHQRASVLAIPIEQALSAGMERIDLNHGWAGAMIVPGRVVERLFDLDLPEDIDIPSSLMRCALQMGVKLRLLPEAALLEQRWIVVRSPEDVQACEKAWLQRQSQRATAAKPSRWAASHAMLRLGPALQHKEIRPLHLVAGAVVMAISGIVLAWIANLSAGMLVFAGAVLAGEMAFALGRMGRLSEVDSEPWPSRLRSILDLMLVLVLTAGLTDQEFGIQLLFLPLVMGGLVRLLDGDNAPTPLALSTDRVVLCLGLAVLSAFTGPAPAMQWAILALLAGGLVAMATRPKLTPA